MKKLITLYLVVLITVLSSCYFDNFNFNNNGIKGYGQIVSEFRDLAGFDAFDIAISGNTHLLQGNEFSFEIRAQQNIIDIIETVVINGELNVRAVEDIGRNDGIDIFITMPEVNKMTLSGSGNIFSDEGLNCKNINIMLSGSGNIKLHSLFADNLKSTLSGSGEIAVYNLVSHDVFTSLIGSGNIFYDCPNQDVMSLPPCYFHQVDIIGSGNCNMADFNTLDVDVLISGSGNCFVSPFDKLCAKITGSGNIYYKNRPKVNSQITGSGKLLRIQ